MEPKRRWLILTHSFNMDGRAASQMVTDKLPYLLENGIELTVISAMTGNKDKRFEHFQLLPWGPSGLRFDSRHLLRKRFGRGVIYRLSTLLISILLLPLIIIERLVVGLTHHASWTLPATRLSQRLIRERHYELIYSSGGAWSAHMAAALTKRATHIKWIAEIHDPMVIRNHEQDDGSAPRATNNAQYLQKVENIICNEADHIWWFTETAKVYAILRHPNAKNKSFVVYPGAEPPISKGQYTPGTTLNIAYFGSLTKDRSLSPFILALATITANHPEIKRNLCIHIYGGELDGKSRKTLGQTDLMNMIKTHGRLEYDSDTGFSGRVQAMQNMFAADILLLLHGDYEWCAEYIPSKFYEYLWANRPIAALTHRNPLFDAMLKARNAYLSTTLDSHSIEQMLNQIYQDWRNHSLRAPKGQPIRVRDAVETILRQVV